MCSNNDIVFRSIGTKSLVAELEHIFPHAKIARFDSDNKKHEGLEHMYTDLLDGTIDILVGTQLLGKGLDLPKLSVLGIIQADTSLSFPDYTAEERTYQLIRQALGRINRGHVAGKAFVQTHHPDNQLIKFAVANDYTGFYKHQLEERRLFRFPPFTYTLKLSCSRAQSSVAEKAAQQLAHHLQSQAGIEIIGPSPTFTPKINNRYHWQIIVKAPQRSYLTKVIQSLPANWSHDIDPNDLL